MESNADSFNDSISNLQLSDYDSDSQGSTEQNDEYFKEWGFCLPELFRLSVLFYKEQGSKAIHLNYEKKLKLIAFYKQASKGKYKPTSSSDIGFLDIIGNNRRKAWQDLGDMSKSEAKSGFIELLSFNSSQFKPFIEAHRMERDEQLKKQKEDEERLQREKEEQQRLEYEEDLRQQEMFSLKRQQEAERHIRQALNEQTTVQFQEYAKQQCPDNLEKQRDLIHQLQEQHFQQYMQQLYQQQLLQQQKMSQQEQKLEIKTDDASVDSNSANDDKQSNAKKTESLEAVENGEDEALSWQPASSSVTPAKWWKKCHIDEFKQQIRHVSSNKVKISSLSTGSIRVPTHEDGNCLYWEFCTDYYDIGFGLFFEWTTPTSNEVMVTLNDSDDEEFEEEPKDENGDLESGAKKKEPSVPTDCIIPIYRRDCHEEVYCGSHVYPGRGVYLLKFDNSYSMWRSKTLYYRVYFTK